MADLSHRLMDELSGGHRRRALANLAALFPDAPPLEPKFAWSGRVATTKDHFPHLHWLDDGLSAGLGFNGRGVAMGTMVGRCLSEAVQGRQPGLPLPLHAGRALPLPGNRIKPLSP